MTTRGESSTIYQLVNPLGKQTRGSGTTNVWKVISDSGTKAEFVAKGPSNEDDKSRNWPAFQNEVKMQRLFALDRMIRRMLNFVPASELGRPMMI